MSKLSISVYVSEPYVLPDTIVRLSHGSYINITFKLGYGLATL